MVNTIIFTFTLLLTLLAGYYLLCLIQDTDKRARYKLVYNNEKKCYQLYVMFKGTFWYSLDRDNIRTEIAGLELIKSIKKTLKEEKIQIITTGYFEEK